MSEKQFEVRVQNFIAKMNEKADLEADLKALKEDIDQIKKQLIDDFSDAGFNSIKSSSGETVYLHRQLWATFDKEQIDDVVAALESIGAGDLAKTAINKNALSAWTREHEEDQDGMPILPNEVKDLISCSETFDVRMRRS